MTSTQKKMLWYVTIRLKWKTGFSLDLQFVSDKVDKDNGFFYKHILLFFKQILYILANFTCKINFKNSLTIIIIIIIIIRIF